MVEELLAHLRLAPVAEVLNLFDARRNDAFAPHATEKFLSKPFAIFVRLRLSEFGNNQILQLALGLLQILLPVLRLIDVCKTP